MEYCVKETYTPDDDEQDRSRREAQFTTESVDLVEVGLQARVATYSRAVSDETLERIRQVFVDSDVEGQVRDQEIGSFEFVLFSMNGEWALNVQQCD